MAVLNILLKGIRGEALVTCVLRKVALGDAGGLQ